MNQENMYYSGNDRGIILLHSYTSGSQDVQSLARFLNREGYSVYTPNLSGHGVNVNLEEILSHNVFEWKKDVEEAVQFMMDKGFKKVALFGLSLGGIMSFNQLINDDRGFAGGAFSSSPVLIDLDGVKDFFMTSYTHQMKQLQQPIRERYEIEQQLEAIFKDVKAMNEENLNKLQSFEKPVFIGQGEKDTIVNPEETIQFRNMLHKNQIHFHWYKGAPHVITVGAVLTQLRVDVLAFLSTLDWN